MRVAIQYLFQDAEGSSNYGNDEQVSYTSRICSPYICVFSFLWYPIVHYNPSSCLVFLLYNRVFYIAYRIYCPARTRRLSVLFPACFVTLVTLATLVFHQLVIYRLNQRSPIPARADPMNHGNGEAEPLPMFEPLTSYRTTQALQTHTSSNLRSLLSGSPKTVASKHSKAPNTPGYITYNI